MTATTYSYTPNFSAALKHMFEWEGYESDDPDDSGGHTKWGISKNANPEVDIDSLTKQQATDIYFKKYWRPAYDKLDKPVAVKLFTASVHMSNYKAHKIFQTSINRLITKSIKVDGVVGPITLRTANNQFTYKLLAEMTAALSFYYCTIVRKDPTQDKFLMGWLRRAAY